MVVVRACGWAVRVRAVQIYLADSASDRLLPDLVLVLGHDHTAYQFEHVVPGLAKGHLTAAERAAIHRYEAAIFTPNGRLRPDATPSYIPGQAPGFIGQISPAPPDR